MIKSIALKNFRGFRDHTVEFTPFCLLIGQNNAGKTTLVEALRIVSSALSKMSKASFVMAPERFSDELTGPAFKVSIDTLDIEARGIHYNYRSNEPAVIRVRYNNNCQVCVVIGDDLEDIYCQLLAPGGKKINSRSLASPGKFKRIHVMPPVGALLSEETERNKKYLYKHLDGYLSHRHIRNQMAEMPAEFDRFCQMLTDTWSTNLQVGPVEQGLGEKANNYGITIRDGPFISEMALVGSGLQAWIQTTWFLARVERDAVVVLDEPDVFLHADLQRKLIKLLSEARYRQTIVATHSMEMIADVAPAEIILVSKRNPRSKALSSSAQAQGVVESIGTNLNIQLSKVAHAGKIVFVEGKDYGYLDQVAFKIGNKFYDKFVKIPHFSVGGMNNWPRAALAAQAFYDTSEGRVEGVMFIDRDYKTDEYIGDISAEAEKDKLRIIAWSKKEVENFILNDELIYSYLIANGASVKFEDVAEMVGSVVEELGEKLKVNVAGSIQSANRKLSLATAMENAERVMQERVNAGVKNIDIVGGKAALSMISGKSQKQWGVQISPMSICRHMPLNFIPKELRAAVESLL